MNRKTIMLPLIAAAVIVGAPVSALADGAEPSNGVRVQLGAAKLNDAASQGVSVRTEHGVKVYRAKPSLAIMLAGPPEPAPQGKAASEPCRTVVIERHYYTRLRRLRTQGFYSGHPGKSRRFTQGFYSGSVDWGQY